jgi:prepilin-type N-terminal cleavage/methylation domain-containing protein
MNLNSRVASDRGITMVELLVAIVLGGLVLAIVGGIMFNMQATQVTVSDSARAANSGQLILRTIEGGVRNASAVSVTEAGALLRVQHTTPTGTTCQAWYYDATVERLYTTTAPTSAGLVIADASTSWTLLGQRVVDTAPPGLFVAVGDAVQVTLSMASSGQNPIELVTTATPRLPKPAPPTNCLD